jgi:membrane protease YdiL (CAAX protease family)
METTEQETVDVSPAAALGPAQRSSARRQIGVFLSVVTALTAVTTSIGMSMDVDVSRIEESPPLAQAVMFGQAFIPLIAAAAARSSAPHDTARGWGVRRTTWRRVLVGAVFGAGFVALAAVVAWMSGAAGIDGDAVGPALLLALPLTLLYVVLALGEDIGWRGLLVARLSEITGPRTVVLISGLAWGLFHWPLMIWLGGTPDDTATIFTLASYTVGTVAFGAVLASMQLRWGLWPGVVAHAAANAVLYHAVTPLTEERAWSGYLAGETGFIATAVLIVLAVLWCRRLPLPTGGPTRRT